MDGQLLRTGSPGSSQTSFVCLSLIHISSIIVLSMIQVLVLHVPVIAVSYTHLGYTTRNSGGVPQNFKNYFVIEFDKPFTFDKVWADYHLVETHLEQLPFLPVKLDGEYTQTNIINTSSILNNQTDPNSGKQEMCIRDSYS